MKKECYSAAMPRIAWESVYSVGIKELDAQHRQLIDFMNVVYERLDTQVHTGDYSDFFAKLKEHAGSHFATEEKYFVQFKYEGAAAHKKEHRKITARIDKLEEEFSKNPSLTIVFETLQFLDDWLFDHTMMYDKKYVEHFKKCGLS